MSALEKTLSPSEQGIRKSSSDSTAKDSESNEKRKSPQQQSVSSAVPKTQQKQEQQNQQQQQRHHHAPPPPTLGGRGFTSSSYDSFFEYVSIFSKQQKKNQRRHVQDLELRFTKQIFHEFDEDASNSIDIDELKKVMEAMGHEMTEVQLRELLEQVDINRSGDLSFSEFVQLIALWKAASQFKLFESDAPTIQDQRISESLEPDLLLSDSWYRMIWDGLVYFVILYSFFLISYVLTTLHLNDGGITSALLGNTFEIDIVATVVVGLDLILNFFTAQRVSSANPTDRRVLDSLKEVAWYHVTNIHFYVDIFSLLPLHRFTDDKNLLWLGFNTLFRICKAPRLFQRSQRMQLSAKYVYVHFYLVPLAHALVASLIFIHLLSCFWTLVQRGAVSEGAPLVNKDLASKSQSNTTTVNYVSSLYFILATVTTTGFGDVYVLEHSGRIVVACILCVVGTLTTGIVIGNIVSTLSKTNIHTDRENKLVQTLAVLNYFSVPAPLANEILNFQNHLLLHNLGDSHKDLIRGLPDEMQKNISLFSRINLVSECVLFKTAHQGTKVAIAEAVKTVVFRPDENVIVQNEVGDCMYFVSYGVLGMKLPKQDKFFQRGGYFGEIALLARGSKRTATIKALTYCDLFMLTRETFRHILSRFPKFRIAILHFCEERKKELISSFDENKDWARKKQVMEMKFIHEEEEQQKELMMLRNQEHAASLLIASSGHHQNREGSSENNNNNQQGANNNNSNTTAIHVSSANENNNSNNNNSAENNNESNNNNVNSTTTENNNNNNNIAGNGTPSSSNRGGSNNEDNNNLSPKSNNSSNKENDSPCGEAESSEHEIRANVRSCSSLLTDIHEMIHSMTHGQMYTSPSPHSLGIYQQQQQQHQNSPQGQQNNNNNSSSSSSGTGQNNQQQPSNYFQRHPHHRHSSSVSGGGSSSSTRSSPNSQQQSGSSSYHHLPIGNLNKQQQPQSQQHQQQQQQGDHDNNNNNNNEQADVDPLLSAAAVSSSPSSSSVHNNNSNNNPSRTSPIPQEEEHHIPQEEEQGYSPKMDSVDLDS